MADNKTIRVKMDMTDDLRDLLNDLKKMDVESQTKLKDEVSAISKWTAQGIIYKSYNAPMPAQAAIVAQTVKYNRDRVPNVTIGGARGRKASGGASPGELLMGNEFGANPTSTNGRFPNGGRRFPFRSEREGRGNAGYWIFPALREMQPEISRRWWDAADKIFRHWQRFG
jgi:hypothetical protein